MQKIAPAKKSFNRASKRSESTGGDTKSGASFTVQVLPPAFPALLTEQGREQDQPNEDDRSASRLHLFFNGFKLSFQGFPTQVGIKDFGNLQQLATFFKLLHPNVALKNLVTSGQPLG